MHCIAALAVLKQFWCRVIKRLRITLLCPWCYYILWWLSSIKIYKIGGSETLKQWLSSIRIINIPFDIILYFDTVLNGNLKEDRNRRSYSHTVCYCISMETFYSVNVITS